MDPQEGDNIDVKKEDVNFFDSDTNIVTITFKRVFDI